MALLAATLPCLTCAKECADCHSGQDRDVTTVSIAVNSIHAGLDCSECHAGLQVSEDARAEGRKVHGQKPVPVSCESCHDEEAKEFSAASHGARLKESFDRARGPKPAAPCLACHSGDPHAMLSVRDPRAPTGRPLVAATCLACHAELPPAAVAGYASSVHGEAVAKGKTKAAVCTDCHGSHAVDRSTLRSSRVFHATVPQTCGRCHADEQKEYAESIHWAAVRKGIPASPVCTGCHGEHAIRSPSDPTSSASAANVTRTCAACHASEQLIAQSGLQADRVPSFKESFHGLSGELGDLRVANCASCHSYHAILPASDPRSPVNPANLGATCGRCHPGAENRFINERVHTTPQSPSHWLVAAVRWIYTVLLVLVVGSLLVHDLLDFVCKRKKVLPYHRVEVLTPRLSINERLQHAVLALSFLLLAWSGFALRFPHSPFAWLFRWFANGSDVRRWVHRGAAFVLIALAVYHLIYLLATTRGRAQLQALRPRLQDWHDARNVLARYLGRSDLPVQLPHYGYTEKSEYWALVWGTAVMTVTGFVLLFINFSLSHLPLWVVDLAATVHFWEALLAVLVIIVWHGYWTVLDPDCFPLNLTWLLGRPRSRGAAHDT